MRERAESERNLTDIALILWKLPAKARAEWMETLLQPAKRSERVRAFMSAVSRKEWEWAESYREQLNRARVTPLSWLSADYPHRLRSLPNPPPVLFTRGAPDVLPREVPTVGIVGTRRCTRYGERVASELATELAALGMIVVSGLAFGIDAAAHAGSLVGYERARFDSDPDCATAGVAVLASGVDVVTPTEHYSLASDLMRAKGVLVSEYALGAPAQRYTFPERNRIIAGLCDVVVVVEAGVKSGASITARLAIEAGREVFAVPGPITSPSSQGTNRLLRDGCSIYTSLEDLLARFPNIEALVRSRRAAIQRTDVPAADPITGLLEREGSMDLDGLADALKRSPSSLAGELLRLEMTGRVVRLSDGSYATYGSVDSKPPFGK